MKRYSHFPVVFASLLVLSLAAACSAEIETITSTSPDGNRTVTITGSQESGAGPIEVKVRVKVPAGEKDFFFQHQGSKLTSENVKVIWKNNDEGTIEIEYDDGDKQVLAMSLGDRLVRVVRVK